MDKLCALFTNPKGFWCLLALFHLSLANSWMIHPTRSKDTTNENQSANITVCFTSATNLMRETENTLYHFQETFNCTMPDNLPDNPNNEEKIKKACMGGKSSKPGFCMPDTNDVVDQGLCMDTIYTILRPYAVKIKNSPKLLNSINLMMQALKSDHNITEEQTFTPYPRKKSYEDDFRQCENLLILQPLTQIIHRILKYLYTKS